MMSTSQPATGIGAAEGMNAAGRDREFEAYLAARQAALLRTAYLLTGDRRVAEDLVRTTLARLYLSWDQVIRRETADHYVHRTLARANGSMRRRACSDWTRRCSATPGDSSYRTRDGRCGHRRSPTSSK